MASQKGAASFEALGRAAQNCLLYPRRVRWKRIRPESSLENGAAALVSTGEKQQAQDAGTKISARRPDKQFWLTEAAPAGSKDSICCATSKSTLSNRL